MININLPLLIVTVISIVIVILIGRKRPDYAINFFLRIGLCYVAIYFINNAFLEKGMDICVAMNAVTFLMCGFLGFPGLFLLYGLVFLNYFGGINF